jgi:hypothetical protein
MTTGQIPKDPLVLQEYKEFSENALDMIKRSIQVSNFKLAKRYILWLMLGTDMNDVKSASFWKDDVPQDLKDEVENDFPKALKESREDFHSSSNQKMSKRESIRYWERQLEKTENGKNKLFLFHVNIYFLKTVVKFIDCKKIHELSIKIRKLKNPYLTGIEFFDQDTKKHSERKLEILLGSITPECKSKLEELDLDTPFDYESELPEEPEPILLPEPFEVCEESLRSELGRMPRFVLCALFALLTQVGITSVQTECDNSWRSFSEFSSKVQDMLSGKIKSNQATHWDAQHCRDRHGCPNCRALCALLTILRYAGKATDEIHEQICRSVWQGSLFSEQAMCQLLYLLIDTRSALAQVVKDPESSHRTLLINIMTEMNVQETLEEKSRRERRDEYVKVAELMKYKKHKDDESDIYDDSRIINDYSSMSLMFVMLMNRINAEQEKIQTASIQSPPTEQEEIDRKSRHVEWKLEQITQELRFKPDESELNQIRLMIVLKKL